MLAWQYWRSLTSNDAIPDKNDAMLLKEIIYQVKVYASVAVLEVIDLE
jgi:hypothetical protein